MRNKEFRKAVTLSSERTLLDRLRDHPIWIFGSGAAAMAAFGATVILPTTNTYLNSQLEKLKPAGEQLEVANKSVDELKSENKKLKKELDLVTLKSPFSEHSIYPTGLGQIRVGDSYLKVKDVYKDMEIVDTLGKGKKSGYSSVKTNNSVFNNVTYYYDIGIDGSKSQIDFILFQQQKFDHDYLLAILTKLNGSPKYKYGDEYAWHTADKTTLILEDTHVKLKLGHTKDILWESYAKK